MSDTSTDAEELLREWLEIQQELASADKDLRNAIQKGKSAPNRRVRKTIRELRKLLQALSKKLIGWDRACVEKRKTAKQSKKGWM